MLGTRLIEPVDCELSPGLKVKVTGEPVTSVPKPSLMWKVKVTEGAPVANGAGVMVLLMVSFTMGAAETPITTAEVFARMLVPFITKAISANEPVTPAPPVPLYAMVLLNTASPPLVTELESQVTVGTWLPRTYPEGLLTAPPL